MPLPFRIVEVTGVHKAPSDYPSGKEGDVLTVTHISVPMRV